MNYYFAITFKIVDKIGLGKLWWIYRAWLLLLSCGFALCKKDYSCEAAVVFFVMAVFPWKSVIEWTCKCKRPSLVAVIMLSTVFVSSALSHGCFTGRWMESLLYLLATLLMVAIMEQRFRRMDKEIFEKYAELDEPLQSESKPGENSN